MYLDVLESEIGNTFDQLKSFFMDHLTEKNMFFCVQVFSIGIYFSSSNQVLRHLKMAERRRNKVTRMRDLLLHTDWKDMRSLKFKKKPHQLSTKTSSSWCWQQEEKLSNDAVYTETRSPSSHPPIYLCFKSSKFEKKSCNSVLVLSRQITFYTAITIVDRIGLIIIRLWLTLAVDNTTPVPTIHSFSLHISHLVLLFSVYRQCLIDPTWDNRHFGKG